MEAGQEAMGRVLAFAQTTPFQIETATKAFISLKSAGIEPSNRMLQVFADTASTSTDQLGVFEALVKTVQSGHGKPKSSQCLISNVFLQSKLI